MLLSYFFFFDAGNAGQGFTPHVISVAAGEVCLYPIVLDVLVFLLDVPLRQILVIHGTY